MDPSRRKLSALVAGTMVLLTAIVVPIGGVGLAGAANQSTIQVFEPGEIEEDTSVTHELTVSFTGVSLANGPGSSDTVAVRFPENISQISSYSVSVSNETGSSVIVTNRTGQDSGFSFEINHSGSTEITVNGSVTVQWGSVNETQTDIVQVKLHDSDGSTTVRDADITINNVKSSDVKSQNKADAPLTSGDSFWQGHELFFDASNVVANDKQFELWSVTGDDTLDKHIFSVSVDATHNTALIETGNLSETKEYVITYQGDVVQTNENGVATSLQADDDDGVATAKWFIVEQSLEASFDDDYIVSTRTETTDLAVTSNRGQYTIRISAEDLNASELDAIFNHSANTVQRTHYGKDFIELAGSDSISIEANFTGIDPDEYSFDVNVPDTNAETSASINVTGSDAGIRFSQATYSEEVGDFANITLEFANTDEGYVFVGSPEVNYLERIHVVDADHDGHVSLVLNTWAIGRSAANRNLPENRSAEGIGYQVIGADEFGSDGIRRYDSDDFENGITISSDLSSPLDPAIYPLRLSASGELDPETATVTEVADRAALSLLTRDSHGLKSFTAPGDTRITSVSDIRLEATRTSSISVGDRLILELDVSGIFGYINESYEFTRDGAEVNTHGLYVTVRNLDAGPNHPDHPIDVSAARPILDPRNDRVFLVFEANDLMNVEGGQTYLAELVINESNAYIQDTGPGVQAERVQQRFSIVERSVSFDNTNGTGVVDLPTDKQARLSGSSTVAPGQRLEFHIESNGDVPGQTLETAVVQSDGSFETTVDTSALPMGTPLTISASSRGTEIRRLDGIIGSEYQARITVEDQPVKGGSLTVDRVFLSQGGYIVLFSETKNGSVLGVSEYLSAGSHNRTNISITAEVGANSTVSAVAYGDRDGDRTFDRDIDRRYGVNQRFTVSRKGSILAPTGTPTGTPVNSDVTPTEAQPLTETSVSGSATKSPGAGRTVGSFSRTGAFVTGMAIFAAVLLSLRRR